MRIIVVCAAAALLLAAPAAARPDAPVEETPGTEEAARPAQSAAGAAAPGGTECAEGGVSGLAPAQAQGADGGVTLARVNEVASRLICICGCGNMVLDDCECGEAAQDKEKIRTLLAAGKSPDQVVAVFVADDGEQRLAAPSKKGFNLLVWTAPFAALILGGVFVTWVLRSWTRRAPPRPGHRDAGALTQEDRERLDEELRRGA